MRLGRADIKNFLLDKLREGYDAGTVSIIYRTLYRTLRAMLSAAVVDEVIAANPAMKLGRALGAPGNPHRREF